MIKFQSSNLFVMSEMCWVFFLLYLTNRQLKFVKWTCPSLSLDQSNVNFRDIRIKMLKKAANSMK